MKRHPVEYRQTAMEDLQAIFEYVCVESSDVITASRYVDRIFEQCEKIGNSPHGYTERSDLRDGIRLVPFEKSAVILYVIENETVWITNILSGKRDYEALFRRTEGSN